MSETENCRFVWAIGSRAMKVAIVPAILAVLLIASCPAAGETMNLGTARFVGSGWTPYDTTEVEFLLVRDNSGPYDDPFYMVSWYAEANDVGEALYVSAETSEHFKTLATILSNGNNNAMWFSGEAGAECDFFVRAPGIGGDHCDFFGWKVTALSLTIHSLEIDGVRLTYDVTVTVWGETLVTATTYYVDTNANGLNDGSSWANAHNFLQDALADANSSVKPVEILVAQGNYFPDSNSTFPNGTGNREATFRLVNGITIKGGYAGSGYADANSRNIEMYRTVLSGDLAQNDSNYRGGFQNYEENSYSVVTGSLTDGRATLDGFIISGGNANLNEGEVEGSPFSSGGGMFVTAGSPTVRNCRFLSNRAEQSGGGMCNYTNSHPTVINCTFLGNDAGRSGGAMRSYNWCNPVVVNSSFIQNSGEAGAGGMSNHENCNPTVTNCRFSRNTSGHGGGGMTLTYGHIDTIGSSLTNCIFSGNWADSGGGGINILSSNATLPNCVFTGNRAGGHGPAIGGGTSNVTLVNCIVRGHPTEVGYMAITVDPTILYSNVEGSWPGMGNIDADPCFANPGYWIISGNPDDPSDDSWVDGDYHLKSESGRWVAGEGRWVIDDVTSPCIDAGDTMSPIGYEPFPNGGMVNMGAYGGTAEASKSYFGEAVCETIVAGDVNGDCIVDFRDVSIMLLHWLEER